jgi:hypothetical protein
MPVFSKESEPPEINEGISMDAFPTYSDLVASVATTVFCVCYAIAIVVLVLKSRANDKPFTLSSVVVALLVAISGSALSFLALFLVFRNT